ncbi:Ribosomal protein L9/RNase H1, N-terminal [Sesbania bispinosa]|nr:Ribosomal protein L9/RNase H1, N-terminal [Sesbania bispinosa]
MAMRGCKLKKTYVVFIGRQPGFYSYWPECQHQVIGYRGSLYQAFNTREEAHSAWLRYWSTVNMNDGVRPTVPPNNGGALMEDHPGQGDDDGSGSSSMGVDMRVVGSTPIDDELNPVMGCHREQLT